VERFPRLRRISYLKEPQRASPSFENVTLTKNKGLYTAIVKMNEKKENEKGTVLFSIFWIGQKGDRLLFSLLIKNFFNSSLTSSRIFYFSINFSASLE